MAINPLAYTEKIVQSFLRYQVTAYPFADDRLDRQMRDLLSLDTARQTPLLKGPFVSLSRAFRAGCAVEKLAAEKIFHPHMKHLVPWPSVYGHQEQAIRAIHGGRTTLISTGTGSGKSECFLYPVISRCLELRDAGAPAGICAVIVYPMNALAEDQLGRLRALLAGTGVTFGMYVGKTPDAEADVGGRRLEAGASRKDYEAALRAAQVRGEGVTIHPAEEVCSREMMREPGGQPRILLTNVKQLELLLTRPADVTLFDQARLDFLVFDEAHTFTGANGAETACLIRRLRSFCGRKPEETVCVATSATIVDEENPDAARDFAGRFFGVERNDVVTVNEIYEEEVWASPRSLPRAPKETTVLLREVLGAVDAADEAGREIRSVFAKLTGEELAAGRWDEALHARLAANELLFQVSDLLVQPRALHELLAELKGRIGRDVAEEELIIWLTLGAAARKEERPLIRPVVHGFIRGMQGAIVTFDEDRTDPTLHLSAEDDAAEAGGDQRLRLKVLTCTTCGQHYFEHSLSDFSFTGAIPGGGTAAGDAVYWETMDPARGGMRLLLIDRLISEDDDEEADTGTRASLHLCRKCGAAHLEPGERCLACGADDGLLELQACRQREDRAGYLTSCVCCGATGKSFGQRFREPIRAVRAVNVSDVHVLAQDMVHHAERRRLLVFADNRQDAAFQAGWMTDHSRRFRLRSLIYQALLEAPLSVGDLTYKLDQMMEANDSLSRTLLPEVWAVQSKESGGNVHRDERRYFLRIQVLREITIAPKHQTGLEPWGRIKVHYLGIEEATPFIQEWAGALGLPPDELKNGIECLLDLIRRKRLLYDTLGKIFSRFWMDGDRERQVGYLPEMRGVPKGVKLIRAGSDDRQRIDHWHSSGHRTVVGQIVTKWGVASGDQERFLEGLWNYLTSDKVAILKQVTLTGARGNALQHCHGAHQIDGDRLRISVNKGVYRCRTCRRRVVRPSPRHVCLAYRCNGTLEYVTENPDDYNLQLVDQNYEMIRPREHTAMVPHAERERIELIFKGDSDTINALVCTQTLELGVDIGSLDAVLMRNVPPLPANYWQRAGRAGRRHRMAVNLTYCRPVSHDRSYFHEPLKMLGGRIDPPSFNLSNELMVAKHVRATILTRLHQLARPGSALSEPDRKEIEKGLHEVFPTWIRDYLFNEDNTVRGRRKDVSALHTIITSHQAVVESAVCSAFQQGWPASDGEVVTSARLARHVLKMTTDLEEVLERLFRRLTWALKQMSRLEEIRQRQGTLDDDEKAFYDRCDRLVKKFKSSGARDRRRAEGIDDTLTLSVLAAEGFLPGYGLETGSIQGMAQVPRSIPSLSDFDLPRPPSVAIREYVPGNLIYANGQKFVARNYRWEEGEERQGEIVLEINTEREAVKPAVGQATGNPTAAIVTSRPICDVTLIHASRISDEEDNRFQMAVAIHGRELDQHNGGHAYQWGEKPLLFRKGVRLQLVNVGPRRLIESGRRFGFPVCRVCGQSVSPLSSQRARDDFAAKHAERGHGEIVPVAFHAEMAVDAMTIPHCADREEAYSMAEAIRFAATETLDMDLEDLQVLVIGHFDTDEPDAMLYDPMPGGSGLLERIRDRFPDIVNAIREKAAHCPALCLTSCIDCYETYRNSFYHEHLNRQVILERVEKWGRILKPTHPIPPKQPETAVTPQTGGANVHEEKLRRMLAAAGLPEGRRNEQIRLSRPLGTTTPDIIFDDPDEPERRIFVYLDGLSSHLHGSPATAQKDRQIRDELKAMGHDVIVITAHDLDDQEQMLRHLKRLARQLIGRDAVDRVSGEAESWFTRRNE